MLFMRLAIYAGALGSVLAAWVSVESGLALEDAATRGIVVFLGLATAGYVADLVVVTTPPVPRSPAGGGSSGAEQGEVDAVQAPGTTGDERTPASIAAAREERRSAPERQAA